MQCTHGGKISPAGSAEDFADYPVVFPRILRAVRAVIGSGKYLRTGSGMSIYRLDTEYISEYYSFIEIAMIVLECSGAQVRAVTDVLRPRWEPAKPEEEGAKLMVLYGMDFILDAHLKPYLLEAPARNVDRSESLALEGWLGFSDGCIGLVDVFLVICQLVAWVGIEFTSTVRTRSG